MALFNTKPDAERKIRKARSALLRGQPAGRGSFFGALAMRLDLEANPSIKEPMSTNGRVLRYRPDAITAMPFDQLIALVGHEVIHCCAGHHVRRGKRDPVLYNIAADHVVNHELIDAGFAVPPEGAPDPRFKGMSVERVYTILAAEQPPSGGEGEGDGQGGGKSKDQRGKGNGKGDSEQWAGGVEDMPGDGEQNEGDGEDGGEGEPQRGPTPEQMEREQRDWQMAAVQAAAAAQQMGTMPGFAERYITALQKPKENPWEILREFVKSTSIHDYRWFPPSRRLISSGYYLPSLYSEDELDEIAVIVDTSGSIDNDTLQEFGAHVKAIAEDFRPRAVTIIYCDAAVNRVDRFEHADEIVMRPCGGGGTDFRPAFAELKKRGLDETICACILLSDTYGTFVDKAPSYPFICASTTDGKAPFGTTVHIKV